MTDEEALLVLGDAHADDPENRRALLAAYGAADADSALQARDLALYDPPTPTWFVAGNDEEFDVVEALRERRESDERRPGEREDDDRPREEPADRNQYGGDGEMDAVEQTERVEDDEE